MVFAFLPLLLMTFTFLGRYIAFTEPRQDPAKNKPLAFCFGVG
jgi:Na+-transporting methylmalonyl-CoA/oxaloacetate decarboxylase gamma subunit